MDLNFRHGFIPRVSEENYKAVDRCVGPADLFTQTQLDLPWAIIDGAWAASSPELLDSLRQYGTSTLVDTHSWRYRYAATFGVAKLATTSWSPSGPLAITDQAAVRRHVESSLQAQEALGAAAYLLPGWMPDTPTEDLRAAYELIYEAASTFNDIAPRPMVAFVGGHTKGPDQMRALLDSVPHFCSAIYVQVSPIAPHKDGPAKLEALLAAYRHAAARGFQVIAGHAGSIAPALKALGVDAADAGLATGETFDRSNARRSKRDKRTDDTGAGGGRRSRMYVAEIGRSLDASVIDRLLSVPGAAAEIRGCRLPCHRFRGDHVLDSAREHSLWARVEESQRVISLPSSMRATHILERIKAQQSTLATINGALTAAGEAILDPKPLENHLTWITRTVATRSAA